MKSKEKLRILFVCNRGGHFSQMMALKELFLEYDSMLVTDTSEVSKSVHLGIPCKYISSFRQQRFQLLFFVINLCQCFRIWVKFRPRVIVSTGANLAVPMFIVGWLLGSKLVFIESRAKVYTKSFTGKFVRRLCNKIIVQWPEMLDVYPEAKYYGQLI